MQLMRDEGLAIVLFGAIIFGFYVGIYLPIRLIQALIRWLER